LKRLFTLALVAVLAACESLGPPLPPPPTIAEILQMAKEGTAADAIIGRMREARAVYVLPASELAKLRDQGLPDKVIDYMQQTYVDAARYQEWQRARDAYLFHPFGPWRYPYGWW